jgi:hypothetical protein
LVEDTAFVSTMASSVYSQLREELLHGRIEPDSTLGPSRVWGSSGNRCLRVGIVGGLESLSEAGTERSIINGAAHL